MKTSDAGTKLGELVAERLGSSSAMGNEVSPRTDRSRALTEIFDSHTAACVAEKGYLSAESTCEARETLAIVDRAIGELPPRCAEAFVLHVLKGLKQEEVGRAMGISAETVRKHVARSFEYIQCCLDATEATGSGL